MRINNKAILWFLIGVPFIVSGGFALKALLSEYDQFQLQREQLALNFLVQTEAKLNIAMTGLIKDVIQQVEAAIEEDAVVATRRLVFNGDIGFITVFHEEERVFPPEHTSAIFVTEATMLARLEVSHKNARLQMKKGLAYQSLVRATDPYLGSLLHCQLLPMAYEVCVLFKYSQLKALLDATLDKTIAKHPNWGFQLTNSEGRQITRTTQYFILSNTAEVRLQAPLQNWVLKGSFKISDVDAFKLPSLFLIIVLPLLVGWTAIFLSLYRGQQAKIKESTKRAELAAHLSHELRTPLANLSLYVDLIKKKSADADAVGKYAQIIQDETDRLAKASENTIAAAQGGHKELNFEFGIPDNVIEKLLNRFEIFFEKSGCNVNFTGGASEAIWFDVAAFESIVLQLLDNACKHGLKETIELSTSRIKQHLYIYVRDYGAGVDAKDYELIFENNYRGNKNEVEGFGIGLAAVRHLARLNGGDIRVENTNPGAKFIASILVKEKV